MSEPAGEFVDFGLAINSEWAETLDFDTQAQLACLISAVDEGSKENIRVGEGVLGGDEKVIYQSRALSVLFDGIRNGGMSMIEQNCFDGGQDLGRGVSDALTAVAVLAWYGGVEHGKHLAIDTRLVPNHKESSGDEEE